MQHAEKRRAHLAKHCERVGGGLHVAPGLDEAPSRGPVGRESLDPRAVGAIGEKFVRLDVETREQREQAIARLILWAYVARGAA